MSDTIRAFIAIPLNPKIQRTIERIQDHLSKNNNNVNWVKPENIHITLKFLGDINTEQINSVKQALANLCQNTRPFKVELSRLGAFPHIDRPRTLWVGVIDSKQQLSRIAVSLNKALVKLGFQSGQKPFTSHITIGRIRSQKNINYLSQIMSEFSLPADSIQNIKSVILYQSTLTPQGPIYEPLHKIKLI